MTLPPSAVKPSTLPGVDSLPRSKAAAERISLVGCQRCARDLVAGIEEMRDFIEGFLKGRKRAICISPIVYIAALFTVAASVFIDVKGHVIGE